ncbi:DUF4870 family protein [Neisseria montereyensis]|uniref:DUF4870 domain-containing protein n=1 Tax=Neisseria montereyensis TaxID=2973938 RepID=A0ABT2FDZ4_9NEIS|nr:hypothetical protein [Neisseria montereyensis]MCS4533730.1 hypothetical protein [Neisseria montereyensis]
MSNEIIDNNRPATGKLRTQAIIVYALYAASLLSIGAAVIAGVIMAYIKRDEMQGTLYYDHMQYLIKTFWWSLLGFIIGYITLVIFIGSIILFIVGIWFIYRVVAGFIKLYDNKPVSPDGWL